MGRFGKHIGAWTAMGEEKDFISKAALEMDKQGIDIDDINFDDMIDWCNSSAADKFLEDYFK